MLRPALFLLLIWPLVISGESGAESGGWQNDRQRSVLEFTGWYDGFALSGRFEDFQLQLTFDKEPEDSLLSVQVRTSSLEMGETELNEELRSPGWFDSERYAMAIFESREVRRVDEDEYLATGTLTIREIEHPVSVPFHWQSNGQSAVMSGSLELSRMEWGVGSGEWAADTLIAHRVLLRFEIVLQKNG